MKNDTTKWLLKCGLKVADFDCCQARTIRVILEIREMCFWVEGNSTWMLTAMEYAKNLIRP